MYVRMALAAAIFALGSVMAAGGARRAAEGATHAQPTSPSAPSSRPPVEELDVLSAGYPRAFFFRTVVARGVRDLDEADFVRAFSQLNGVMGASKSFRDPTSPTLENQYLTSLKAAHPHQMVSVMLSGQGRNPISMPLDFAGHWLYFAGTSLTVDIGAGDVVLPVADTSPFKTGIGRFGRSTDDIAICRRDEHGTIDWSTAEQVRLVEVDESDGSITVERGILGTTPTEYPVGSYLAPHGASGPWGSPDAQRAWFPNFATTCPGDPEDEGRSYTDVYVEEIPRFFAPGGALEAYDGAQFDVLVWNVWARDAADRDWDVDADGGSDDLIVDWQNVYGIGVSEFAEQLRRQPEMASRLITGDGHSRGNHRSIGVLNGVESEGFPSVGDLAMRDFSGGVNRMRFWDEERSHPPSFSYVMFKTGEPDQPAVELPTSRVRLSLAAGPLLDCALTFFDEPEPEEGEDVGIWDEIFMGRERKRNWLGYPLGETTDLAQDAPDLLAGEGVALSEDFISRWTVWPIDRGSIERYRHPEYGWCVKLTPAEPHGSDTGNVVFTYTPQEGSELTVETGDVVAYADVWADTHPEYPARLISMRYSGLPHPELSRVTVSTWVNEVPFRAMGYWRDAGPSDVRFQLVVEPFEGSEPFFFRNLTFHNAVPAMYREFENGAVLANPSLHDFTFDLEARLPGRRYRRLLGSPNQDPVTNDGQTVGDRITLGERDAIFLVLESRPSTIYVPILSRGP